MTKLGMRASAAVILALILIGFPAGLGAQDGAGPEEKPAAQDGSASFFGNGEDEGKEDGKKTALEINGSMKLLSRAYVGGSALGAVGNDSDTEDTTRVLPTVRTDLVYKGASTEVFTNLRLDPERLEDHPEDVVDEVYARVFLGDFVLEGGKMKLVWGKGDKLHVLDLFNANDYTDFIVPDYIERRIGEPLFRLVWNAPSGMRAEAVWAPTMTADRLPAEGRWVVSQTAALKTAIEQYAGYRCALLYGDGSNPANVLAAAAYLNSHSEAEAFLPDTKTLDYGQYGLRVTGTFGPVDLGVSYYLGRFKTPSADLTYTGAQITGLETAYDRLQSFGLEAGAAAGSFNLRSEAAYQLTGDTGGGDPAVKNNRVVWLFGFDVDLPVSDLNINIQTVGSYILGNSKITSPLDTDYDSDGRYSNNKIILRLQDSFRRERIKPELTFIWGIERKDFFLNPKIEYKIEDEFKLELSGAFFLGSRDGEFGAFTDNDFVQLGLSYSY